MTASRSPLWPGVPLALASAALFGAVAPLSKLLLGLTDPWLLAGVLYLGAGLGLLGWRLARTALGAPSAEAPLRWADLPWLGGMTLFGGVLGPVLLLLGLARTDAASASLLLNLEGVATLLIAWVVVREAVDRRLVLGAALIVGGAAVLSWGGDASLDAGGLLVAAACLCWGVDNNLSRRLSAADPVAVAGVKGLVAGATNLALALSLGAALPASNVLAGGALLGLLGVGVSLVLFLLALRHLGTARTGTYYALAPFIGAALAVALLSEPLTVRLLAAGLLMGAGLWLHLAERHEHEHVHEALDHEHAHVHDAHHQHPHGPEDPPGEPHSHPHRHAPLRHRHAHYPDLHHRHGHDHAA